MPRPLIKWASRSGLEKAIDLVKASRFECIHSEEEIANDLSRLHGKAKLSLRCRECGFTTLSAEMFVCKSRGYIVAVCKCSRRGVDSNHPIAQERLVTALKASRFELDGTIEDFFSQKVRFKTKVPLICTVCDERSSSVCFQDFVVHRSAECACSRNPPWASEDGIHRLQALISKSRYVLDVDLGTLKQRVTGEGDRLKLPLRCLQCGISTCSTTIGSFSVSLSSSCNCALGETERRVLDWCKAEFGNRCHVSTQRRLASCPNMPFDIVFADSNDKWILVIEIDGDQHFSETLETGNLHENDLRKESCLVDLCIPLLRLYQPKIWYNIERVRSFDWKTFISKIVEQAIEKTLAPKVHVQPSCNVYVQGVYARKRTVKN